MTAHDEKSAATREAGPVEDALLGHSFDGIQEFDNALPNWWLATFYIAILFSIGYWGWYHIYGQGAHPVTAYESALAAEAAARPSEAVASVPSDEELLASAADPAVVESGKALFTTNCVACHGTQAEGKIGPNLTDAFWIHGGTPSAIYTVISEGVPAKGMVPWKGVLGAARMRQVTAYVLSLRNTNVAGKAPEGERAP